ncbi:tetratricopeptide repeat protein [Streptomyces sp. AC550_RSS872]|uniref:tetratricopeptide repeat protein n=1 Tax=Streptomyces sp. AC550_RSS872 TaxID=2823689 RepID=UPI001C2681D7|nr:tetratricopeptide repeat protein [Streptomyces sp. AC550_RSS872]
MSRLSRAMKREQKRAAASAAPVAAPIDVRVPAVGPGGAGASIGGVPVTGVPGEEIQRTVLTHLQRIAVASGHPVHATIHDERIGYVVPLRVAEDGSSQFTAEPVRTAPPREPSVPGAPAVPEAPAAPLPQDPPPHRDRPTQVLRPLPGPEQDASPTFRLRALPGSAPEPVQDAVPGTVAPPLGEFGPPPPMDARPEPTDVPQGDVPTEAVPKNAAPKDAGPEGPVPEGVVPEGAVPEAGAPQAVPRRAPLLVSTSIPDLDPGPTPPRGFDAVAEAVLGDAEPATTADVSPFAEEMARINEAVKEGRTAEATELAERTLAQASAVLGLEHPEVLRTRELAAYIAYLAGDPERAFGLCLDVARTHHRTRDAEAAYGSLYGAATAWRAVRDPALGLALGRDLLGLWSDLVAEGGPAAEEAEELESARARMDRLAARAAKPAQPPTA